LTGCTNYRALPEDVFFPNSPKKPLNKVLAQQYNFVKCNGFAEKLI
jgi:hypothetical protein